MRVLTRLHCISIASIRKMLFLIFETNLYHLQANRIPERISAGPITHLAFPDNQEIVTSFPIGSLG